MTTQTTVLTILSQVFASDLCEELTISGGYSLFMFITVIGTQWLQCTHVLLWATLFSEEPQHRRSSWSGFCFSGRPAVVFLIGIIAGSQIFERVFLPRATLGTTLNQQDLELL